MARHAEGWRLVWRRGVARVRFRHEGRRLELTTGSRDPGQARAAAARIYAEVVSGQRLKAKPQLAARAPTIDLVSLWLDSLDGVLDVDTIRNYELHASAEWLPRWKMLGEIATPEIASYQRTRLRQVTKTTLQKELSALRGFLAWCVQEQHLQAAPDVPELGRRVTGKRAQPRRVHIPLTEREAWKVIDALPERSKPHRFQPSKEGFIVRDFFVVLWETSLRPATVERLSTPEHYTKGADALMLYDDADKARHDRGIPLSKKARAALDRCCSRGLIFGEHAWREYLRPTSERVLGRRIALDDFRHSRITRWLADGKNIVGVQHLAGHKHLSTTARYTHVNFDAAARVLKGSR